MKFLLLASILISLSLPALSAPPPMGSDDWNFMKDYKAWVESRTDRLDRSCCTIGDGRPVEAKILDDHWVAHVTPQHFPDQKDHWIDIPDEKLTKGNNPTGTPILWLYEGRVQCFAPPDGA